MGRRLVRNVVTTDGDGRSVLLRKGTVVSDAQAARIRNPRAFASEDAPVADPALAPEPDQADQLPVPQPAGDPGPADGGSPADEGAGDPDAPAGDQPSAAASAPAVDAPPRSGPGSNRDAWAAYAAALGQQVPAGMSRDDIVQALTDAELLPAD